MLDLATQPPEVISAKMYAGPGSASLRAAATAWTGLAADLAGAATEQRAVLAGLTGESWTGPSSAAMTAAGERYADWLESAAGHAGQAGAQAAAAAQAFETALAATVPPALITANRTQRAALATGPQAVFHLPEIAALDAAYLQYCAQDVAAMLGYAAGSAAATRLDGFTPAPATTRGDGGVQAAGAQAAAGANSAAGHIREAIPQVLNTLAGSGAGGSGGGAGASGLSGLVDSLKSSWTNLFNSVSTVMKYDGLGNAAMSVPNFGMVQFKTFFKPLSLLPDIPKSALGAGLGGNGMSSLGAGLGSGITGPAGPLSGGYVRAVTADVGGAPRVSGLSVPTGWATATPAVRLAATSVAAAAAPAAQGFGAMLSPAGLGAATGGALGAVPGTRLINAGGPRAAAPAAGGGGGAKAPVQLDKVLAQLQKQQDAVQHWSVDEAHLDDLLEELAKKPGFHAVHLSKTPKPEPVVSAAPPG